MIVDPEEMVQVRMTYGELRALQAYLRDGGVVGEMEDRRLRRARARLNACLVEVLGAHLSDSYRRLAQGLAR